VEKKMLELEKEISIQKMALENHKLSTQLELENIKQRLEDYKRENERRQSEQDRRIEKLEDADTGFYREASERERQDFSRKISAIVTIGATVLGAILTLLFSQFIN
jgi:hypothetical protein